LFSGNATPPYLFNSENGLEFGRWLFEIKYDSLKTLNDVTYKGGDIELKPSLNY